MGALIQGKLDLIERAFNSFRPSSFADLGGVWGVNGGYTFHAMGLPGIKRAVLVDYQLPQAIVREAESWIGLDLVQGPLGNEAVIEEVGDVDAIFLFDILLHQVNPDWREVIKLWSHVPLMCIWNQMWTGPETVRLLDLGEEEYFRNVPHDRTSPSYRGELSRNATAIWQWGITKEDFRAELEANGHQICDGRDEGQFHNLENFRNCSYITHRK